MVHRPLIGLAALRRRPGHRRARVGEDRRGRADGRRAGLSRRRPASRVSRTTGYQIKVADERSSFVVPEDGKIVAWSIALGKPTDRADLVLRQGPRRPGLGAADGPARRQDAVLARRHARARSSSWSPYFGQTVQFPLGRALNVKKGYVIALTVPTWAPALTPLLTDHCSWRASRAEGQVRRHRHADRADGAQAGRAVPLPLQGAADLLGDAGHPPGTQPGATTAGDVGSRGGWRGELDARRAVGHVGGCGRAGPAARRRRRGRTWCPRRRAARRSPRRLGSAARYGRAVRHRDVGVAGEDDARADRDPVALEPVRVAGAVPVLVLVADDRGEAARGPWCGPGCARRRSGART